MEEQKILQFYDCLASLLQQHNAEYNFFEELVTALLWGHVLGDTGVCTSEFYEASLL